MDLNIEQPYHVDVVIAGGGTAGQSAAGLLAGCQRKVTLVDANATGPAGLACLQSTIDDVERSGSGFTVHCNDGTTLITRALLLASDAVSHAPAIEGADQFFGTGLHQCPYCDAWEHRDRPIGVLGADDAAVGLALKLLQWSSHVTIYANGGKVDASWERRLKRGSVEVVPGIVRALEGEEKNLKRVRLQKRSQSHFCEALFFPAPRKYHTSVAERLGCDRERIPGAVHWRPDGDMVVEGLFVAGTGLNCGESPEVASKDGLSAAAAARDWLLEADHAPMAAHRAERGWGNFHKLSPVRQLA